MTPVLILLVDYLIGAIPFGYLIVKMKTGEDVRASGSGNIGATNVLRTTGRAAGVITLLLDIVKGFVAVWLMSWATKADPLWCSLAALAVMAGHAFPVFLNFKGGKAVASFIGCVRDINEGDAVGLMYLEHYPGMTERELEKIATEAKTRWDIFDSLIIHRVGELRPLDQIVFVAVTSAHRGEAFAACEFIMDFLKTRAPFWKRESTPQGERWVDARSSDDAAAERWQQ